MNDDKQTEVTVETALGKLATKGIRISDVISLAVASCLALLIYIMLEHKTEAKESANAIANAITKLANSQTSAEYAQREMTCIISLPPDKREAEFFSPNSLCKRFFGRQP